jgi:hypothetical protein
MQQEEPPSQQAGLVALQVLGEVQVVLEEEEEAITTMEEEEEEAIAAVLQVNIMVKAVAEVLITAEQARQILQGLVLEMD